MTDAEADRVRVILTEIYALDLARVLRHALCGASHWRIEAQNLLALIDAGVIPHPHEPPSHQSQDAA